MKVWHILAAAVLSAGPALAQTQGAAKAPATNAVPPGAGTPARRAPATKAPPAAPSRSLQTAAELPTELILPSLEFEVAKANEIKVGKVTCSGIAVQAIKSKNPLQLLNPAAPAQYGSGRDNVLRFPLLGRGPLLKVFSIDF